MQKWLTWYWLLSSFRLALLTSFKNEVRKANLNAKQKNIKMSATLARGVYEIKANAHI